MRKRGSFVALSLVSPSLVTLVVAACGGEPGVGGLRDSFSSQISAISYVHDFQGDGDELTFLRPDGSGEEIAWRVRIYSALVEPHEDEAMPYRGLVESSWWLNDRRVLLPSRGISNLPLWILDEGISEECWALWDSASGQWGWK